VPPPRPQRRTAIACSHENHHRMTGRNSSRRPTLIIRTLNHNVQFTPPARHDKTVLSVSCLAWRCESSRPDRPSSAFCVGVRPAVAPRRPTHSDTDQTQNAPVWRSGRLSSHRHTRHDKTVLSVSCLAWRCELALKR